MYKKIISLLTILSMTLVLFAGVPISVSAEVLTGDGWTFDDVTGKLTVSKNSCNEWADSVDKLLVKSIETDCRVITNTNKFYGCSNLEKVTMSDVTEYINGYSFQNCRSLKSITIPKNVIYIDETAFKGCTGLETVFYPDTLTVNSSVFDDTPATQIKYNVNGGKLTITDIIPNGDTTTVDIGKMDGIYSTMTADTIIYKDGLTVSGDIVSPTTTKIEYTENDGKITVSKIITPNGVKAEIPATINGMDVVEVAEEYQDKVDTTKHTTHTYVNGECTICGTADPNAGNDDDNNDDNNDDISLSVENNTLTISGTGALDDLSAFDGDKESITDVVIEDGITSVGDNAFDGFTSLETVYYPQDTTVSGDAFPESVTQVEYSVDGDGVVIENIVLGSGVSEGDKVVIPDKIGGKDVVEVAAGVQDKVSDEGHTHNYANGSCTICGAADPNTGSGSQETTQTTPSNPPVPPIPSRPSNPVVTPNVTSATETTATTAEEIIADGDYTGEDISSGAGDNSDDGGIADMSMVLIVIAMAAVIACAVLIKKLIF